MLINNARLFNYYLSNFTIMIFRFQTSSYVTHSTYDNGPQATFFGCNGEKVAGDRFTGLVCSLHLFGDSMSRVRQKHCNKNSFSYTGGYSLHNATHSIYIYIFKDVRLDAAAKSNDKYDGEDRKNTSGFQNVSAVHAVIFSYYWEVGGMNRRSIQGSMRFRMLDCEAGASRATGI